VECPGCAPSRCVAGNARPIVDGGRRFAILTDDWDAPHKRARRRLRSATGCRAECEPRRGGGRARRVESMNGRACVRAISVRRVSVGVRARSREPVACLRQAGHRPKTVRRSPRCGEARRVLQQRQAPVVSAQGAVRRAPIRVRETPTVRRSRQSPRHDAPRRAAVSILDRTATRIVRRSGPPACRSRPGVPVAQRALRTMLRAPRPRCP